MPNQTTNAVAAETVTASGDEFLVHTRHTCDNCYTRPIVGKRYSSEGVSDFDLCAKCFAGYDGMLRTELSETLLARDKATKNSFILKLKIEHGGEEAQTRRINVGDLWESSVSQLSFSKLISIASCFAATESDGTSTAKLFDPDKAKVTYIDEDGDKITISSNEELMDSFVQTVKKQPSRPFRITVTAADAHKSKDASSTPFARTNKSVVAPSVHPFARGRRAGRCGRIRDVGVTEAMMCRTDNPHIIGLVALPPAKKGDDEVSEGKCDDKSSSGATSAEAKATTAEKSTSEHLASSPFFIHARHTCDGCSKTPIIGTRYHATMIPNFDLCEACFKTYEGENLDFVPETLSIDWCMQPKWLKKQLAKSAKASTGIVNLMKLIESSAKVASEATSSKTNGDNKSNEKTVDAEVGAVNSVPSVEVSRTGVDEATVKHKDKESTQSQASESDRETSDTKSSDPQFAKCEGNDDSFFADAEGNGSIAEVIGRTLDICVQAMEEALTDEFDHENNNREFLPKEIAAIATAALDSSVFDQENNNREFLPKEIAAIATAALDSSVASSMISSVTDILKKMEDFKCSMPAEEHHTDCGETIVKSVDDQVDGIADEVHVEDGSVGSDGWSVIDDNKEDNKDDFAGAAELIGSFLYNSGVISNAENGEETGSSKEPLSPIVLAKWDMELKQLNELGFTDEHKNVEVLERLEASHVGCDSTDKVTVNAVVDILLDGK